MSTRYMTYVDGREEPVEIIIHVDGTVEVDGERVDVDLVHISDETIYSMLLANRSHEVFAEYQGEGEWILLVDGERHEVRVEDERMQRLRQFGGGTHGPVGDTSVDAPMPGLVVKVLVDVGDPVGENQPVVILEAMKMENELRAPVAGVIKAVRVQPGTAVNLGESLVIIGPPSEDT
nr:biotin/lipoyl-containing protein [Ardenticatena sp.]